MIDLHSISCLQILLGVFCLFAGFYAAFFALLSENSTSAAIGLAVFTVGIVLIWRGRGKKLKGSE